MRQYARKMLPGYMVPSAITFLNELPVTVNGKLERAALPELVAFQCEDESVSRGDRLETQLLAIWQRTLKIKRLGIADDFFELGGDSLLAARIFSEIKRILGKNLPLATLFQAPTIEKLAAVLREAERKPRYSPLVAIQGHGHGATQSGAVRSIKTGKLNQTKA
jgi:acyl carrier protein